MSNPARAAECCLSSLDVLAVKLLLNKDWYDEVQISLSEAAVKGVPVETPKGDLAAALEHTREAMYFELGVVIPRVRVELDDSLGNNEFRIQLNDMRLPRVVAIDRNEFLVDEAPVRLPLLNLSGRLVLNPSTGTEASAVRDERGARERCEQAGLTVWGAAEFISLAFTRAIRRNADLLMSRELAEIQLSQLREVFPDLVRITQQRVQIEDFTLILRDLLRSGLSIRDLRGISEALLFDTSLEKSGSQVLYTPHVVEALRESRCKELFYHHAGISPLVVCLIDGRIEQALGNRTLGTLDRGQVLETMCHTLAGPLSTGQLPKLLTHGGIRRDIHDMVRIELPDVTVLSYEELPPGLNVGVPTGPERRIDIFPLFQIETTRSWSPESDQDLLEGELKSVWEQMARLEEIRSFSTAGLSDEDMAVVYAKGYYLFLHGCYEPAQSLFRRLAEFAPHNVAYWRALGVMHQKLGDYERAIFAFNQAVSVDDAEIVSRLYRAESYILSDNKGAALPDLDEILRLASGDPELDVWTKRAELLLVVHRDAANQR